MKPDIGRTLQQKVFLAPSQRLFLSLLAYPSQYLHLYLNQKVNNNPFLIENEGSFQPLTYDIPAKKNPHDFLLLQLQCLIQNPTILLLARKMLGMIDKDGYLRHSDEELSSRLKEKISWIQSARKALQSIDPPGLGSRNLQESLLYQIKRIHPKEDLAYTILSQYWDLLIKKKYAVIAKKSKTSLFRVSKAITIIRSLSPKPSDPLEIITLPRYIKPDLRVVKTKGTWSVTPELHAFPSLAVNREYERLYLSAPKRLFKKELETAMMLIQILEERRKTILSVAEEIISRQQPFFHGKTLFPLREQDIADCLNISVSTVSRAIQGKYLRSPRGTIPVKLLISPKSCGSISRHALSSLIAKILSEESYPLSDREIAEKLRSFHIVVSIRTVNKYRHKMGMLNSYLRK
jgi:RNA polymerase sigma-54 factor